MENILKKIDKLAIFFVLYTFVFVIFFGTIGFTLPFVFAFILASLLKIPTKFLMKKFKLQNTIASLFTTTIFFTVIVVLLSLIITTLTSESILLGKNIQSYITLNKDIVINIFSNLQNYYKTLDPNVVSNIESNITNYISKTINISMNASTKIFSQTLDFVSTIPYILMVLLFTLLTTYFFTKDLSSSSKKKFDLIPRKNEDRLHSIFDESKKMLKNYLLSYLLIITITFLETLIVFIVFKVKYAVTLSVLCGLFDLLPIFGIGAIYLPVIIIFFISNNYVAALGLLISYIIITIVRQIIEPKIVSSSLGIHPVAVLASIFIGLRANGIVGMLFCMFFLVFYNILKKVEVL
ncbi:sporulation integral membrane protein YtvI [Clostridium sp. CM028]|uniref:sporulation integral membrane protein YtvI n=1 Tax=unclassified Clostridium TaxID=2614128 RepID=UPI001C0BBE96|nr:MULTISPECIES: sporulation integral membrane protein YtvI [unclassified Clostridium]MBU3091149.1 sporulation integral membrane protein YtvI [Clostridium sp. CF011]MBW9144869.1 sporulation integral membrane protein YtvI [Clostridium sp. CM027]MBW9148712.1 sporulation integral membrane protein YtvI [Clostridium sp. CM028]UVE40012.1 sporulation integral membrane protein YtvI [Clostridium sp. CM027]WAG68935.1 sporulation integral membrane protein YtvI [Clostridium sp. CF011]